MQVFLAFADIEKSLSCLDRYRLGKQRVETKQILDILYGVNTSSAWVNHPAVKMFEGYGDFLKYYYRCCIDEWVSRGYKNNMAVGWTTYPVENPPWFGEYQFHLSHRSNLLRKAYDDAAGIGAGGKSKKPTTELLDRLAEAGIMYPDTPKDIPYYWPTKNENYRRTDYREKEGIGGTRRNMQGA